MVTPALAAFEDIEVSPRQRGLGSTGFAMLDDAYAPLRNPSTLAWAADATGAFSYLKPFSLDFASQNVVTAATRLPGAAGGIGIGIRTFGVRYQDQNLDQEATYTIAHGFRLLHDAQSELAFGWSASLLTLSFGNSITGLDPGQASTVAVSMGATATVRDRTRVGFVAQNINSPRIGDRDYQDLARRLMGGISYTPYAGVTTLLDMRAVSGESIGYGAGIELEATDFLKLRAGIATEPNTFSAGLGIRVRRHLQLDYGFSTGGGVLEETHHVGFELHGPTPWGR
jgi:hypothetical protein